VDVTIIPRRPIVVAGRPHHVTLARLLRPHHDGRPGFDVLDGLGEGLGGVEVKALSRGKFCKNHRDHLWFSRQFDCCSMYITL